MATQRRVLATLYEGLCGERRRFDVAIDAADAGAGVPASSDLSSPRDLLTPPASATPGDRWRWLRAGVGHRAAHREFGTGAWQPAPHGDDLPGWLVGAVAEVLARYASPSEVFYALPGRDQFAQVVEYLEDHRVEARLLARYRGLARDVRRARALEEDGVAVPDPVAARARLMHLLRELSLDSRRPVELPASGLGAGRAAAALFRVAARPDVGFAEVFVLAMMAHHLLVTTPFMAVDGHAVQALDPADRASDDVLAALARVALEAARRRPDGVVDLPREGERNWMPPLMRPAYRDALDDLYSYNRPLSSLSTPKVHVFAPGRAGDQSGGPASAGGEEAGDGERSDEARKAESPWEVGQLDVGGGTDPTAVPPVRAEPRETVSHEPEWDHLAGAFLPRWCRVVLGPREHVDVGSAGGDPASEYVTVDRAVVGAIGSRTRDWPASGRRWSTTEMEGDDIAVDEYVRRWVDERTGNGPAERYYRAPVRDEPDVVSICGIDLSLSTARRTATERWPGRPSAPGRDERVVDLEARAALTLADLLDRAGQECGVYGFWSGGRHDVRLVPLKPLGPRRGLDLRIERAQIRPTGGTRMAAALRRLSRVLDDEDAETRILIMVCDGRPFDRDYADHHGPAVDAVTYALEDTLSALREAEARGQIARLLVCGAGEGDLVTEIIPPELLMLLERPTQLAESLVRLHGAVLRAAR